MLSGTRHVTKLDHYFGQIEVGIAELWIDATMSSDTSILGDDQPDPGDSVSQFALRQSDSTLNETVLVDGLVVGETFEDVVAKVPEPTTAIFLLMGIAGALLIRRRTH